MDHALPVATAVGSTWRTLPAMSPCIRSPAVALNSEHGLAADEVALYAVASPSRRTFSGESTRRRRGLMKRAIALERFRREYRPQLRVTGLVPPDGRDCPQPREQPRAVHRRGS